MTQLLAFASSCIGGQTTVPTSGRSPACEPPNLTPDIERRVFGVHALDVTSMDLPLQTQHDERALRITLDVMRARTTVSSGACTVEVAVELSSDDGTLEYSGRGKLSRDGKVLQIGLEPAMDVLRGSVTIGELVEIELHYFGGSVITAEGSLPP